ncbi:unnamed protein product [Thlaspi arvense]|uniref:Pectinesterase inhibitor domain-containing protein n=1 Tax=Thlaspi arvense TaxID=13288 RepID=A0AAU9S4Q6_THLAR|nr:unnamed protein product [Thlaspi arvense]
MMLLIAFPVANAIPAKDIDKLCNETPDVAFCLTTIGKDPRIPAARDLGDVLLIAWTTQRPILTESVDSSGGPNGKRRIEVCKVDYGIALARFHTAWELARIGTDAYGEGAVRFKVSSHFL